MKPELSAKLQSADRLPTIPGVALQIIELAKSNETDLRELSDVISRDPALASKLLRTANSSMFGLPREVSDLRQAVLSWHAHVQHPHWRYMYCNELN